MSYAYLWEFEVNPDAEERFLEQYGPEGAWVRLFRQADGYTETLLLRDRDRPSRYVTVDRWTSASAYKAFRDRFEARYAELDRECENLTASERCMGCFDENRGG